MSCRSFPLIGTAMDWLLLWIGLLLLPLRIGLDCQLLLQWAWIANCYSRLSAATAEDWITSFSYWQLDCWLLVWIEMLQCITIIMIVLLIVIANCIATRGLDCYWSWSIGWLITTAYCRCCGWVATIDCRAIGRSDRPPNKIWAVIGPHLM